MDQRLAVCRLVHCALHSLETRHHASERSEPAHSLHLAQLRPQIVKIELAFGHLGRELLGILNLDGFGGTLNQADDIAHAKDSSGDALGVERLELVECLADAGKLDRLAGHGPHRERSTATGITIHSGEDYAR